MSRWRSPHDTNDALHLGKRDALLGAIALSLAAFLLQAFGSWYTGSLALLGDSAHVMADLFSLIMSLVAVVLAARPTTQWRSFGFFRLEVLASFVNGLLLLAVSLGLAKEGLERLWTPQEVKVKPLLLVAVVGLLLNLISAWLLSRASNGEGGHEHLHHHGHEHDHHHAAEAPDGDRNLRSAMLHVWSDALGSMAVIGGALVIQYTGWIWVDAAVGCMLAIWIFRWSWRVILDAGHVLLESTPKHLAAEDVVRGMHGLDQRVKGVDDLHVWELTSRMYAATAEVRVQDMSLQEAEALRKRLGQMLQEKFGIAHVVLAIRPS